MDRRLFLGGATAAAIGLSAAAADSGGDMAKTEGNPDSSKIPDFEKWQLADAEWRKRLSPEAYAVLRKDATERPWTSPLNEEKRPGSYLCAGCGYKLFRSEKKFDSGTGWPSFFDVVDGAIGRQTDFKLILPRTEYHCARCGGHQGHVFNDGPSPTGLRYCNNGVALSFTPD